jgi:hypothetical protein
MLLLVFILIFQNGELVTIKRETDKVPIGTAAYVSKNVMAKGSGPQPSTKCDSIYGSNYKSISKIARFCRHINYEH